MMRWSTIAKILSLGGGIGLGILALNVVLTRTITMQYHAVVTDPQIITAFTANNETTIKTLSNTYKLEYQRVEAGQVVFASSPDLPQPQIIPTTITLIPGVQSVTVSQSLAELTPARVMYHGHLYVVVPFFADTAASNGYIVYAKVLL